jgi:hypothetical protein
LVIVIPAKNLGIKKYTVKLIEITIQEMFKDMEIIRIMPKRRNYNSLSPLKYYNVECYKCKNYGHKSSECRLPKYDKKINILNNKKVWKKTKT